MKTMKKIMSILLLIELLLPIVGYSNPISDRIRKLLFGYSDTIKELNDKAKTLKKYDKSPQELAKLKSKLDQTIKQLREIVPRRKQRIEILKDNKYKYILDIRANYENRKREYIIDLSDPEVLLKKIYGEKVQDNKQKFLKLAKKAKQIMNDLDNSKKYYKLSKEILKHGSYSSGGKRFTLSVNKNKVEETLIIIKMRLGKFGGFKVRISVSANAIIVEIPGLISKILTENIIKTITEPGELNFQIVDEKIMVKIEMLHSKYFNYKTGYLYHSISVKGVKNELKKAGINWSESDLYPVEESDQYGNPIRTGYIALKNKIEVEGKLISDAHVGTDGMGRLAIFFSFNSEGARKMGKTTARHISTGKDPARLAIVLDRKVKSAPAIMGVITNRGQITGSFTVEEVSRIVAFLNAGVLLSKLKVIKVETIEPR